MRVSAREVTAYVLGLRQPPLTETLAVDIPATWWQHWKMAHLASWWAGWVGRRWPVRTRTFTATARISGSVERAIAFPESNIVPDDPALGRPVMLLQAPSWDRYLSPPRLDRP